MLRKICGMTRQNDLDVAAACGFDFCGFIFHPRSPRAVTATQAAALTSGGMKRVGVFVDQTAAEIRSIMRIARLNYAQLHGKQGNDLAAAIGRARVIRVLWPQRYENSADLESAARRYADFCAYFLLDAGDSGGGSGETLAWKKLAGINLPRPWFLAGGLNERNAAEAILQCSPHGLDFNSGLEDSPGVKNAAKLKAAIQLLV